ncbi:MAG: 4-hydroxy-tetrahydrodipicolinate synthase [Candidatus Omnitrophica bacterium]|nr:4-hydroxy-tetrahydrodipicolinate synthase [Candidatus Omnitrophota bacterium]
MFKGCIVAIVTPFKDGEIDEKTYKKLIDFCIEGESSGIVPCGTTGESATLSYEEHDRVVQMTVEYAKGRVSVIAGTGSNSTQEAITLTKHAAEVGADATLQVAPYYNRPTQKGLYEHFKAISETVDLPVILYNIPSRTGVNIEPETVAKLASRCKNIIGIKEASGNLEQMARIKLLCGEKFLLFSGDDALTLPVLSIGGDGVISVVANIVPKDVSCMINAFYNCEIKKAQQIYYKLLPLIKALFLETNPIPLKEAMGLLGLCSPEVRLPLCSMSEENLKKLKKALIEYGLLKEELVK